MTTVIMSDGVAKPISDYLNGVAASIKVDGDPQVAPGAGGLQIAGYDRSSLVQRHVEVSSTGALLGLQGRQDGFWKSFNGRSFSITPPTPGTPIVAQATFVATTPTLIIRNSGANVRDIIRSLRVVVASSPANPVNICVVMDTADRYVSGGTALTPQNDNTGSVAASAVSGVRTNPTASAAGGGTRVILQDQIPAGPSAALNALVNDKWIVGFTGSFLVYIYDSAGAVAPSVYFYLDTEESA